MHPLAKLSFAALAFALALGFSSTPVTRADDAPAKATGTISGRVVDADGKPVKGAHVAALPPAPEGGAAGHQGGAKAGDGSTPGPAAGRERPKPLASTESAEDGTFKLDAVPAGKVRVIAMLREVGRGMASAEVTAGQDTKLGDIKLNKMPAPGAGGAGGHNAPGAAAPGN